MGEIAEKKFPCAVCEKKFVTEQGKVFHEVAKHGHNLLTAVCPVCKKVVRGLKKHMEANGCAQ